MKILERGALDFPNFLPTIGDLHDLSLRQIRLTFCNQGHLKISGEGVPFKKMKGGWGVRPEHFRKGPLKNKREGVG